LERGISCSQGGGCTCTGGVGGSEGQGGAGYFLFFFLVQSLLVQLAQAKNSDQQVWKPKIHASNG